MSRTVPQTNRIAVVVAALVALAAGGACTIPVGDGELGQLRVAWAFADEPRCAAVGVQTVSVQVVGAAGAGGAQADCTAGSVVIPDLPAGRYQILLDAQGTLAWQGSAERAVAGGDVADAGTVKLEPVVGAGGAALAVQWSFAGDASCARTGVTDVDVAVSTADGGVVQRKTAPCADGGVALTGLPAGDVTVALDGRIGDDVAYSTTKTATLSATPIDLGLVDLDATLARVDVAWTFDGDPRCDVAGVTDVSVQAIDDAGASVAGETAACLAGRVTFAALPAAHLTFVVDGLAQGTPVFAASATADLVSGANDALVVSLAPASSRARMRWLFDDGTGTLSDDCAAAGVATIDVQVRDAAGAPEGGATFACVDGAGDVAGLLAGDHVVVADGVDGGGATVFHVEDDAVTLALGDNDVALTLTPATATARLTWRFDPGDGGAATADCAAAGVTTVNVQVLDGDGNGAGGATFACADGSGALAGLGAGDQRFVADGLDGGGNAVFHVDSGVVALALGDNDVPLTLAPSVARARVTWLFNAGGGAPVSADCGAAGVANVSVQVLDGAGQGVGGATFACADGTGVVGALPAGAARLVVSGLDALGGPLFNASVSTTLALGDNDVAATLVPDFATARVHWQFVVSGTPTADCGAAGVDTVRVQVFDGAGNVERGATFACTDGIGVIPLLSTGAHRFVADAFDGQQNRVFQERTGNPRGVSANLALGPNDVAVALEP